MYNNSSDVASDSAVDIFKEEFRDLDEIVFENDLRDLICLQFGLSEEVYVRLMECGMDTESLLLIKDDDLKEIFPTNMLGTRVKFRSRISQWRHQLKAQKFNSSLRISRNASTPLTGVSRAATPPLRVASPLANNMQQSSSSLFAILQSCPKGQTVLKYFEENSKILDEHRILLVNVIVDYHKDRSIAMSINEIVRFTEEIGVLFPTEEKRYYYSTRGKGLNPMGKLYDKAINARRKVKKQFPDSFISRKKVTSNEFEVLIPSKDELDKKYWLSQNQEPWLEVLKKWILTFRIRRAEILKGENILLNWPLFNTPMGYKLVDIDFAEMFPESPKDIIDEWQFFRENIGPYLREKIKDPDSKELMEKLNDDIATDSKDCLIVYLLHAVIKPPLLSTKLLSPENGNKRRKWKPSISDAQNATVLHCTSMDDYQFQYERLKSEADQRNKNIQPVIVVIGEDLTKLEEFYVLHYCILYKVDTFIKALDILFKLFYVMNLDFRLEPKYLYELIESYFLKIKISSNPNIISVTNYLNDCKPVLLPTFGV